MGWIARLQDRGPRLTSVKNLFLNPLRRLKYFFLVDASVWICKLKLKGAVASGPFAGLRYTYDHVEGKPMAKMLGTYEMELHPSLFEISKRHFDLLINVGAAEGYYAVGACKFWNIEKAIAFESLKEGQELIEMVARQNNVANKIAVYGTCTASTLERSIEQDKLTLLIMDIEGAEIEVLDSKIIPKLANSFIILETHDFIKPGCAFEIIRRFEGSHNIHIIKSRQRICNDFPFPLRLSCKAKLWMMDERRPCEMQWLIMIPHSSQVN